MYEVPLEDETLKASLTFVTLRQAVRPYTPARVFDELSGLTQLFFRIGRKSGQAWIVHWHPNSEMVEAL